MYSLTDHLWLYGSTALNNLYSSVFPCIPYNWPVQGNVVLHGGVSWLMQDVFFCQTFKIQRHR